MRVNLTEAIKLLQQGEVVAIPTETVYGLAADATNDAALQKIFVTKQRPADHPLIVHLHHINQVSDWVTEFPVAAVKLAQAFWPGALTLVLPAKAHVSRVVRGGESTVALRIPNHDLTLTLLKLGQLSVAAPSANLFTQLSPTTAAHVEAGLGQQVAVLDGGACQVGIESTIVSVEADGQWRLLRPGMISEQAITAVIGIPSQEMIDARSAVPKVPGQHLLHYSPRTPLSLFPDRTSLHRSYLLQMSTQKTCAALLIGEGQTPDCAVIKLPAIPALVAEQLYNALHTLDDMKVDELLVELPPDLPEWAAVRDRLSRAGYRSPV
jgi:L-threonylcarbamoyladenylate synthase